MCFIHDLCKQSLCSRLLEKDLKGLSQRMWNVENLNGTMMSLGPSRAFSYLYTMVRQSKGALPLALQKLWISKQQRLSCSG